MAVRRREFLGSAAAAAALPDSVREARADFPWAARETYLNTATEHPLSRQTATAIKEYVDALTHGPDAARDRFENGALAQEVKRLFARLIGAKPAEIGFCPSTQFGENIVVDGLDIAAAGGNVVTDDLHYGGSLLNYRQRAAQGLEVRLVKHRDYAVDLADFEKAVDRKTRLVALALVSNVNGYVHDIKAIAEVAHAHGAYVYADVIQAAGAVPVDVRAMGIDFLACSAYKWLMGGRFGYLYVREDLQGAVLKPKWFGGRSAGPGAARYEVATWSHIGCVTQHAALQYIHRLGVANILAHTQTLVEKLRRELPPLGYACITPPGTRSPIISFRVPDAAATRARLRKAGVVVTLRGEGVGQMRVSPAVFNNLADVERLIEAVRS